MTEIVSSKVRWTMLILWQLTWVIAVIGASFDLSTPGFAAGVATFFVFAFFYRQRMATVIAAVGIAVAGCLMDFGLIATGVLEVQGRPELMPIWLIGLWFAFATAPSTALHWLSGKFWLQIMLGATGGLFAWWSAQNLGAVRLSTEAWVALPITWAFYVPCAFRLQKWAENRSVVLR